MLALVTSCSVPERPDQGNSAWQYQDLRVLEAPNTPLPDLDLIAAYARETKTDLELRVDLFGSPAPFDYDLYMLLDSGPGGGGKLPLGMTTELDWDLLMVYPARGLPVAITAEGEPSAIRPRILRDGETDSATVRLSLADLPESSHSITFQAFLAGEGENIADSIGPVQVIGSPPNSRAPLALVFWESLPSTTPAQALRRWDGAHTGPYGQRHGLSILLQEAARTGVPVAILDLKRADRLAALDALGGLPLLRTLLQEGLVILPDVGSGDPRVSAYSLAQNRQAAGLYKIPGSPFGFGAFSADPPHRYRAMFARLPDAAHVLQWGRLRLIPLPAGPGEEGETAGQPGLGLSARRALLETALSADAEDLVVLGGELPSSPWGDLLYARPAFAYLAGHPWVQVLDGDDLLHFPARQGSPACVDLLCLAETESSTSSIQDSARAQLEDAPDQLFTRLAWQTYLGLTEPTSDSRLTELRAGYLGQVGRLAAAAEWNLNPREQATCTEDLSGDGNPDCILSSKELFLVIDPRGARLVLAAARTPDGPIQLVGPRSQLIAGLGDPSEWRPELGEAGDPQEIPGGFADSTDAWALYEIISSQPGEMVFSNPQSGLRKTYRLSDEGFQVMYEASQPVSTRLPLLLLDRGAFQPGWYARYQANHQLLPDQWSWMLDGGPQVDVTAAGASLDAHSFSESMPVLGQPEDPNSAYSPGHFFPFPLAVVDISAEGNFCNPDLCPLRVISEKYRMDVGYGRRGRP